MSEKRQSGYVMTLEAHRERVAAADAAHDRETAALRSNVDLLKGKVRDLVSIRLTKPGSADEQRAWDELMELVNFDG